MHSRCSLNANFSPLTSSSPHPPSLPSLPSNQTLLWAGEKVLTKTDTASAFVCSENT